MEIFLIVLGIYLIPIIVCHIIAYFLWTSDKESFGDTFKDLYDYIDNKTIFDLRISWFPSVNICFMCVMLFNLIITKLSKLRIR